MGLSTFDWINEPLARKYDWILASDQQQRHRWLPLESQREWEWYGYIRCVRHSRTTSEQSNRMLNYCHRIYLFDFFLFVFQIPSLMNLRRCSGRAEALPSSSNQRQLDALWLLWVSDVRRIMLPFCLRIHFDSQSSDWIWILQTERGICVGEREGDFSRRGRNGERLNFDSNANANWYRRHRQLSTVASVRATMHSQWNKKNIWHYVMWHLNWMSSTMLSEWEIISFFSSKTYLCVASHCCWWSCWCLIE